MKLNRKKLRRLILKEMLDAEGEPMHSSGIPQSLWMMYRMDNLIYQFGSKEAVISKLKTYRPEHLRIKLEQLREDYEEQVESLENPMWQYQGPPFLGESLMHTIEKILDRII